MKTKKIIAFLLSCVLTVGASVLLGCKPGTTDDEYPVEEGATVVKIMAREFEQWRNDHFSSLVRKFNENLTDGIQAEVEFVIEESFDDRLQSARETGTAPDVIMHSYNHIYTQVNNGNITSLDEHMSAEAIADIKDMVKPAIAFSGKTYAYPWYTEASSVLFYSKSKFAEAGVTSAPKTWAEMLDACAKIKPTMSKGTYALGMPLGGDIGWATWGMVYNQLGGWPINDNWSASVFDDEASGNQKIKDYARFLDYYGALYDNGYAPISAVHMNGYNEIITAWAEGKYAMTLAVSSQLGTLIQEYPETLSDLGIAVMPTESGDQNAVTSTNGGWCLCIDAKSAHKDLAGKVIEGIMYSDTQTNAEFYEMSGYSRYPALKSVAQITEQKASLSEYANYAEIIGSVCGNAVMEPIYTWNISLQVAWTLENMIQGTDDTTIAITQSLKQKINTTIMVSQMAGKNPNAK